MPRPSGRPRALAAIALLLAGSAGAQAPAATDPPSLATLRAGEPAARWELRHASWIESYRQLAAAAEDDAEDGAEQRRRAEARIAALSLERAALLPETATAEELRALPLAARLARLEDRDRGAEEELAFARWLLRIAPDDSRCRAAGERAVARARAADPALKQPTDELLAAARGEDVPPGGYFRYRGAFLAQARRDRARRVDDALAALEALDVDGAEPPLQPATETTDLERFQALGDAGPQALRRAAAAIRDSLSADYASVRGWLGSYADSPRRAAGERRGAGRAAPGTARADRALRQAAAARGRSPPRRPRAAVRRARRAGRPRLDRLRPAARRRRLADAATRPQPRTHAGGHRRRLA